MPDMCSSPLTYVLIHNLFLIIFLAYYMQYILISEMVFRKYRFLQDYRLLSWQWGHDAAQALPCWEYSALSRSAACMDGSRMYLGFYWSHVVLEIQLRLASCTASALTPALFLNSLILYFKESIILSPQVVFEKFAIFFLYITYYIYSLKNVIVSEI